MGVITNAYYRTIIRIDTLGASMHLRRLQDLRLLEQKGKGNATYYVPTSQLLTPQTSSLTPQVSPPYGELTPHISPLPEGLTPHTSSLYEGLLPLNHDLNEDIQKIPRRASRQAIRAIIKRLWASRPFTPNELSVLLKRHQRYVRDNYLTPYDCI